MQLEPLNGRKPSDMLVDMEKLKPADDKQYFAYMFLQRLLREVRVLLSKEPIDNMRQLAEKADAHMALHQPQSHDVAAPVAAAAPECEEDSVAGGREEGRPEAEEEEAVQRVAVRRKEIAAVLAPHPLRGQSQAV
jgi:hypothetical protein